MTHTYVEKSLTKEVSNGKVRDKVKSNDKTLDFEGLKKREFTEYFSSEAEAWLSKHPEEERKYRGKYIAFVGTKIVAYGEDFIKVMEKAKRYGEDPLIIKVRKDDIIVVRYKILIDDSGVGINVGG